MGDNAGAFGIPAADISPIVIGDFVGSVARGSGANCDVIRFCAHGNGTHTECIGHITKSHENVADCILDSVMTADLITVELIEENGVSFIPSKAFDHLPSSAADALIVRTKPNTISKRSKNWSGNQPPFFDVAAMQKLVDLGYKHLLTDLPSVDPEEDDGQLLAHHVWWCYPTAPRVNSSITELVYVSDQIPDGLYLLRMAFPKIQSDASPSRIFISPLEEIQ